MVGAERGADSNSLPALRLGRSHHGRLASFPRLRCARLLAGQGVLGEGQQDQPFVEHHAIGKAGHRPVTGGPGYVVDALQGLLGDALKLAKDLPNPGAGAVQPGAEQVSTHHLPYLLMGPRYGWGCEGASVRGRAYRHLPRAGGAPRLEASATRAGSRPQRRHHESTPGGRSPSPPPPGVPLLLWPPSRPALFCTPRDPRGCSASFMFLSVECSG